MIHPPLAQSLHLLFLRALTPLLEGPPIINPRIPRLLPSILMLPLPLPLRQLLLLLLLLPALLTHLRLHESLPPLLIIHNNPLSLPLPRLCKFLALDLLVVLGELHIAHSQHAGVGDGLIESLAQLLV